jgi:hypothetical protein
MVGEVVDKPHARPLPIVREYGRHGTQTSPWRIIVISFPSLKTTTMNFGTFDSKAEELIPSEIHMISGCHDSQTSADVSNVGNFSLPNPQGRAGGACTAALLSALYSYKREGTLETTSWVDLLRAMRQNLLNKGTFGFRQNDDELWTRVMRIIFRGTMNSQLQHRSPSHW